MAEEKIFVAETKSGGSEMYCVIQRLRDMMLFDYADGTFKSSPSNMFASMTENSNFPGRYELVESREVWDNGLYEVTFYIMRGSSPNVNDDSVFSVEKGFCFEDKLYVLAVDVSPDTLLGEYDCDVCGFTHKRGKLKRRWDGALVCSYCFEPKHPSERV